MREVAMTEAEVKALVGLAVEEARQRVEGSAFRFRILSADGVSSHATSDLRPDRVDVHVVGGKVTHAEIG